MGKFNFIELSHDTSSIERRAKHMEVPDEKMREFTEFLDKFIDALTSDATQALREEGIASLRYQKWSGREEGARTVRFLFNKIIFGKE